MHEIVNKTADTVVDKIADTDAAVTEIMIEIMIEIELNGTPHRIAANWVIQNLLDALALTNKSQAVAINRQVVPRHRWSDTPLAAHDRVDIVRAIGGG